MDNAIVNTDRDAKLVDKATKAGKLVGRTTIRVARITGVFFKSAYLSAKEESQRIKQCNPKQEDQ